MADPAILRSLIERLEKAEGPDRELDAEIMFELFAKPVGQKDDGGPSGYLWPEDNPSWSFGIRFPGKDRAWFSECRKRVDGEALLIERDGAYVLMNSLRIPTLTASLDAITALIERDASKWDWSLFSDNGEAIAGCQPASEDGCDDSSEHAPTPALALCIAFLRAKLQEMENVCPQFGVWRSIETAPHGVEVILATRPFACMGEQARWEFKVGFASWGERVGGISNRSYDGHAKFWMPLPSPPKEDAE